jgi:catechol 2,3-dioxygenase-like lactoylglutathione lyase family enzyme
MVPVTNDMTTEPGLPATGSPGAFHHATVGVTDLDATVAFWSDNFGLTTRARRDGPDAALGRLWQIPAEAIRRQALVHTPGAAVGALHLVEFDAPGPPVREGAQVCDRLPKNIDLYTRDIAARFAELQAAGQQFRAPPAEMAAGGHVFREAQMPGPDGVNVVIIEVIGPGYAVPLSPRGFAGIGPLVTIVGDVAAEGRFYRAVLGLSTTFAVQLDGPAIERAVGLPPGAGLDLQVFGDPAEPLGRIEAIEYRQAAGANLYPRAKPPARGILHATWRIPSLDGLRARLAATGVPVTEHGPVTALFGSGPVISFWSPAGLRIEVQAAA